MSSSATSNVRGIARRYAEFMPAYWWEAASVADFVSLTRVRLSQSKVGPVVCRERIERIVDTRTLGPEIHLRSHTSDISVFNELVISEGYRPVADAVAKPPRLIVDLGANIGLASRWFLKAWPNSRIVAVEPDGGNAAQLRANVCHFADQVSIVECCIGAETRRVRLRTDNGEFAFYMEDSEDGDIPVITMEELLAEEAGQIDILKCDIEGAERELFGDCRSWITRVGCLVVECHGAYTVDSLVDDLESNGGRFRMVYRRNDPTFDNQVAILTAG